MNINKKIVTTLLLIILPFFASAQDSTSAVTGTLTTSDNYQSSGGDWELIFRGNTTGGIQIPSDAKLIFVESTSGVTMLPANAPPIGLGTITSTGGSPVCVSVSASGSYANRVIKGDTRTSSRRCQTSSNHKSTIRATASFYIKTVMIAK